MLNLILLTQQIRGRNISFVLDVIQDGEIGFFIRIYRWPVIKGSIFLTSNIMAFAMGK